jgi:hypothetical protein
VIAIAIAIALDQSSDLELAKDKENALARGREKEKETGTEIENAIGTGIERGMKLRVMQRMYPLIGTILEESTGVTRSLRRQTVAIVERRIPHMVNVTVRGIGIEIATVHVEERQAIDHLLRPMARRLPCISSKPPWTQRLG